MLKARSARKGVFHFLTCSLGSFFFFFNKLHAFKIFIYLFTFGYASGAFPGAQIVKNPPAMQEARVRSLGREGPLVEEMATHSSLLARKIPCTEEPGSCKRVGYNLVTENVRSAREPLIPQPGIESATPALKTGSLNH